MNSKKETLLSYLYNHSTWSSRNDLSNFLNVSTRQVTNYINEINKNETIVLSSNKGYKINPKFIGKNVSINNSDSIENRNNKILITLCNFCNGINLYDLAEKYFISYSLMESIIYNLKHSFETFHIQLQKKGEIVSLQGKEMDIRRFETIQIYKNSLEKFREYQFANDLIPINKIKKILKLNDIFINDYSLSLLVLNLNVMIDRITKGYLIKNRKQETCDISDNYKNSLDDLVYFIKKQLNIHISNSEKRWINEMLISLSTPYDPEKINIKNIENYVEKKYIQITNEILDQVKINFPIVSFDDDFQIRFTIHIRNCFLQKDFEAYNIDSLTKRIKYSYPLIYDVSVFIASYLEQNYALSMTQNEITYIAFHICSSLSDFSEYKVTITYIYSDYWSYHKKVLDTLMSSIDEKAIIKESVSISDYSPALYHSDLIVTDSNAEFPEPCVHVSLLPSKENIKRVFFMVENLYRKKQYNFFYNNFLRFFSKDCFLFYNEKNYKELIKNMCSIAYEKGLIDEYFLEDVLKREKLSNTVFNTVAIPHSLSVNSKKTFIFIAIPKYPLLWGKSKPKVKLVVMLGINLEDRKTFSHIYDFMVDILSNTNNINILCKSKNFNDFINNLNNIAKNYNQF